MAALALAMVDATPAAASRAPVRSPIDTLDDVLAHTDGPLTVVQLRQACRMRTAHVCQALAALTAQGRVHKTVGGYQRAAPAGVSPNPFPSPLEPHSGTGNG